MANLRYSGQIFIKITKSPPETGTDIIPTQNQGEKTSIIDLTIDNKIVANIKDISFAGTFTQDVTSNGGM